MRVINAAIETPQNNLGDAKERTLFEKFSEFSEHLFFLSEQEEYHRFLKQI
jgi:hypothetical protein